jgi:hypothetical protein
MAIDLFQHPPLPCRLSRKLGKPASEREIASVSERVRAENPVTSCDLHIFVGEASQSVSS